MANLDLDLMGDVELELELEDLKDAGTTDRVDVVGTNAEYAVYLEYGTRHMPPYPFFRPAIREFQANPESFIVDNTGYPSIDAIPNADELVKAASSALVVQMENNVSAMSSSDRSPGTHPDHPKIESGNLNASIKARRIK